jgi:taurine dioxygenase
MFHREIVPFGLEVDMDLAATFDGDELRELFTRHGLLVFREQSLTMEQQQRFGAALGSLIVDGFATQGYISNTRADGLLANAELSFHSDFAYTASPLTGIALHAIEVDYEKTSTRFASGVAAFARLPSAVRERLVGMRAFHVAPDSQGALSGGGLAYSDPDVVKGATHPVVLEDPITGREVLFVNQMNTSQILGLDEDASRELLTELRSYLYDPSNIYEHWWRDGDVVIWSNQAFQHARSALVSDRPRTLQRVVIGDPNAARYETTHRPDRARV